MRPFRIGNADLIEQFQRAFVQRAAAQAFVQLQHFLDLIADRVARIQTGERVLEHHRDIFADDLAAFLRRRLQQVRAVEGDFIGRDFAGRVDQAHQRHHRHAFARAGFADYADHFARRNIEIDPIDSRQAVEIHREIADGQ